eukprot:TRINITY_DN3892_c0_g4_i1.p1 TRINITY_DN3892_c0_g4~~TRINITY_DN3892_c0_g4_i1.p1  ORF type:complete len:365 (-),score=34.37 TRINITY_DN3892_c0_g4_i1:22-1074(-)
MAEPSVYSVHGTLIGAQIIFGVGSVVAELGVSAFNPLLFALIRQVAASVLLLLVARVSDGKRRLQKCSDIVIFMLCGASMFADQAGFVLGDKLAGAVIASAWQLNTPIISLCMAVIMRWEKLTVGKGAGIVISLGGAAFMSLYGGEVETSSLTNMITGNALLLCNCTASATYVIFSQIGIRRGYPPVTITAWSYCACASMMFVVATGMSSSCRIVHFLCPLYPNQELYTCGEWTSTCDAWAVPRKAVLPLLYFILFNSCLAYVGLTWANKHCNPGFVLAYSAIQPLASCILSIAIIKLVGPQEGLSMPGWNALGAIPIVIGLLLILMDGAKQHEQARNPQVSESCLCTDE